MGRKGSGEKDVFDMSAMAEEAQKMWNALSTDKLKAVLVVRNGKGTMKESLQARSDQQLRQLCTFYKIQLDNAEAAKMELAERIVMHPSRLLELWNQDGGKLTAAAALVWNGAEGTFFDIYDVEEEFEDAHMGDGSAKDKEVWMVCMGIQG